MYQKSCNCNNIQSNYSYESILHKDTKCDDFKDAHKKLLEEAYAANYEAEQYTTSVKDLLALEQLYATRIQILKNEINEDIEKALIYETKYKECKSPCRGCYNQMIEEGMEDKCYKEQAEQLRKAAALKAKCVEVLNEERELMYDIAAGHIYDINTLRNLAKEKEAKAHEIQQDYEVCFKENRKGLNMKY